MFQFMFQFTFQLLFLLAFIGCGETIVVVVGADAGLPVDGNVIASADGDTPPEPDARNSIDVNTVDTSPDPPDCVIEGNVDISNSAELQAFAASGCSRVTGGLYLRAANLASLEGLERLRQVDGLLYLTGNDTSRVVDLRPLSRLLQVGSLTLAAMPSLTDLRGLEALAKVTGDLTIGGTSIESLTGLGVLRVGMRANISNNPRLPQCAVDIWFASTTIGISTESSGNGSGACP